ncbi:MAG: outer membrane protein assembly factor [Planctomycetota bacterium]
MAQRTVEDFSEPAPGCDVTCGEQDREACSRGRRGHRVRPLLVGALLVRALFVWLLALLAPAMLARGALGEEGGERVTAIRFEGIETVGVPEDLLRSELQTKVGEPFDRNRLDADVRHLWRQFRVIVQRALPVPVEGGIEIVLKLARRINVVEFQFEGNVRRKDEKVRAMITGEPYGVSTPRQLDLTARQIRDGYAAEGFAFVHVEARLEETERGQRAVFHIDEGPRVAIDHILFEGLTAFSPGDMRSLMKSSQSWFIFYSYYKLEDLKQDLAVVESHLRDEGYKNARVALEELRFTPDREWVDIVIRVDEGPRFRVASVDIEGVEAFPKEEILSLIELKPGDPYRLVIVHKDLRRILEHYGKNGYIRFRPFDPLEVLVQGEPALHVIYQVSEGQRKKVRDVIVRGNQTTRDDVIRRTLTLYPGEWFDTYEIRYSKNRLRSLGFFGMSGADQVVTQYRPTEDPEKEDLLVDVGEGPTGMLNFMVGTQTGRGAFAGISLEKRNFDLSRTPSSPWALPGEFFSQEAFHGGGQRLALRLTPGTRETLYSLDFQEPYLFGPQELPWSLGLLAFKERFVRRDYTDERLGLTPTLGKTVARDLNVLLSLRNEQIDIGDVDDDAPSDVFDVEGKNGLRSLRPRVVYDIRDNFLNPTEGFRGTVSYEYAGGFLDNDLEFSQATAAADYYIPVYENVDGERHVLLFKAHAGWGEAHGDTDEVPIFERFYPGGSGGQFELRGFDYRGVGPHENGDPTGANAVFTFNTEYILPLWSFYEPRLMEELTFLKLFLFADTGTVAYDLDDDRWGRFVFSTGVGLRLRIPAPFLSEIPLEASYGIPWIREEEDERRSFNFTLSYRF